MTENLSPKLVALAFLFGGVLVLTVASQSAELLPLLLDQDMGAAEAARLELAVMAMGLVLGLPMMGLGAWRGYQISQDRSDDLQPLLEPVARLAGEFGARVEPGPDGVQFSSQYHGARLHVLVHPEHRTRLSLAIPAKQRLMVLAAHGHGSELDDAEWRLVGRRGPWVLRAPMPAVARPLLDDAELGGALSDLCRHPQFIAVKHDRSGVEVLGEGLGPQAVEEFLRRALDVARAFQARNGA